ncbi:MAG: protease inhibitor I42 family protein [Clostridia bacterium]|nr:protease inhibitor I42 family protein [Clostridia bacterium]
MVLLFSLLKGFVSILLAIINILGIQFNTTKVELYENPSSGYQWEYSFDQSGIMTLNDTHYSPDTASILSGKGGGSRYFTFRALDSGTVHITFEYVKYTGNQRIVASDYVYTYIVDNYGGIALYSVE